MNLEFIERLIDIVERTQVAELEYSEGDCRIRIGASAFWHNNVLRAFDVFLEGLAVGQY